MKIVLMVLIFINFIYANDFSKEFEEFALQNQNEFEFFESNVNQEYEKFQKAQNEAYQEFSNEIFQKWPDKNPKLSTNFKWVEYSEDLGSRKSVDFENGNIEVEVIAKDEKTAKEKLTKLFKETLNQDVRTAYKNDILQQKIIKKLGKKSKPIEVKQKIVADVITNKEKEELLKKVQKQKMTKIKHKDFLVYKVKVKLPPKSMIRKAKALKKEVLHHAYKQDIPAPLIYAIIHSESAFNPMAKSHVPAYGLMQIVPKTAGIDSYKFLYGKKKLLSARYLYSPTKNIMIGSAYLHILFYKYLKKIENPLSRLYCTIAAYNTGSGNVARAFTGRTNVTLASYKINGLTPQKVYQTLIQKLPYDETKHYLKKVRTRVKSYEVLLNTTL